jgi:hypothetical protein
MITAIVCLAQNEGTDRKVDPSKWEAERIWELAVEAKGGRERLLGVQNIAISRKGTSTIRILGKSTGNHTEELSVFPDKSWYWIDYRPSVLGLRMEMYNWETGKKYVADLHQKTVELEPIEEVEKKLFTGRIGKPLWTGMVIHLLESRWWKPIPRALTEERVHGKKVDVIETLVNDEIVDFFLDRKNHLPLKITFHDFNVVTKTSSIYSVELSDYEDFDGLKMPTSLKENDGLRYKLDYKVNVQYNEEIFRQAPLPVESAAEAWKKKQ